MPEFAVICVITLAYVVWLLSLPSFPTQDGPIHLYYTHVLKALFSQQPGAYAEFYRVKHLLPPYALYYYALLGLSRFVPLLLADKLIVCAYVISFVFGFRSLARAFGPNAEVMTLFASLVLLNWPLGMGFVNFCLSLSLAFWAIRLWLRFGGQAGTAQRVLFVAIAIAAMFTHPVPLLAILGVAGLEVIVRVVRGRTRWRSLPYLASDIGTLFAAACTLAYVKLFTASRPLQQTVVEHQPEGTVSLIAHNAMNYAAEKGVAFLLGPGAALRAYRGILLLAFLLPLAVAVWQMLRDRERLATRAGGALVLAVVAIVLMPFMPHDLNGSHFFAERLLLFVWLLPLLAASGGPEASRRVRMAAAGFVVIAQAIILFSANAQLRPVAAAIASADTAPGQIVARPGEVGLVLEDQRPVDGSSGLSFNPFLWGAVNALRHDNAVMANTPWLDLAIIPLGAREKLPIGSLKPEELEFPSILRNDLMQQPAVRAHLLSSVDFVVIQQAGRAPAQGADPLLAGGPFEWNCRTAELPWIRLCRRDR